MHTHRIRKENITSGFRFRQLSSRTSLFTISGLVLFLQYLFFIVYTQWSYDTELFKNNKLELDTLVLSTLDLVALISVYRIMGSEIKSKVAKRFYSVLAMSLLFGSMAMSLYLLVSEQIGVWRYGHFEKVSLTPVIFIVLPIQALYLSYWGIVFVRGHRIRDAIPKIEIAVFVVFSLIAILAIVVGFSGISSTGQM